MLAPLWSPRCGGGTGVAAAGGVEEGEGGDLRRGPAQSNPCSLALFTTSTRVWASSFRNRW